MKEEETWQGDDWEFGRPSEEPSHTQTHNCSQSCANELAVTTHLGGYQHALIELADALTRHRCSTSLPQCHNAGRGSRGAKPRRSMRMFTPLPTKVQTGRILVRLVVPLEVSRISQHVCKLLIERSIETLELHLCGLQTHEEIGVGEM